MPSWRDTAGDKEFHPHLKIGCMSFLLKEKVVLHLVEQEEMSFPSAFQSMDTPMRKIVDSTRF